MSPRSPSTKSNTDDPLSFEAALERLESLVGELEAGDVPLERSVAAFEEGQRLITYCEQKLQTAEHALRKLKTEADNILDGTSE